MRFRIISIGLLGLLVALVAVTLVVRHRAGTVAPRSTGQSLPVLHEVPEFELQNSAGEPLNRTALSGKVWVADLIFTTCAGTCPAMSSTMAKLHNDYRDRADLNFVSISVNPQYDRPNVLADYAEYYDADPDRWHFLTGSLDAVQDMSMNGLKIGNKDNPVDHSTYFVLVDHQSRVRGYYDGTDQEAVGRLRADIDRLLAYRGIKQSQDGRGVDTP